MTALDAAAARSLERCLRNGGVALFPADTVYGLACAPDDAGAVNRLYELKGRPPAKPAAVLFFDRARALTELSDLSPRLRAAIERLLPGPVTVLLPNPQRRFPLACGPDPDTLGLRVPPLDPATAVLAEVSMPLLQSSANRSGGPDARRVADVDSGILAEIDLVLDAGPRGGTPSTVVDLRRYEATGNWSVTREGALSQRWLRDELGPPGGA